MGVGMVLFWGLLALVVVLVVRAGRTEGERGGQGILDERYARGEIDDDEYRRRSAAMRR
jgi:putative membrane protein